MRNKKLNYLTDRLRNGRLFKYSMKNEEGLILILIKYITYIYSRRKAFLTYPLDIEELVRGNIDIIKLYLSNKVNIPLYILNNSSHTLILDTDTTLESNIELVYLTENTFYKLYLIDTLPLKGKYSLTVSRNQPRCINRLISTFDTQKLLQNREILNEYTNKLQLINYKLTKNMCKVILLNEFLIHPNLNLLTFLTSFGNIYSKLKSCSKTLDTDYK